MVAIYLSLNRIGTLGVLNVTHPKLLRQYLQQFGRVLMLIKRKLLKLSKVIIRKKSIIIFAKNVAIVGRFKLNLLINGEVTELKYCSKHDKWNYFDDEYNCCQDEKERDDDTDGR